MSQLSPELQQIVVRSINALAAACDHAQARDAHGFSKSTAGPGHEIAALGPDRWSEALWDYAGRLSSHHRRQLKKGGALTEDDLAALQLFAGRDKRAPAIASNWLDVDTFDGRRMIVASINENRPLTTTLKRLGLEDGYQPAGSGKLWRIGHRHAFVLLGQTDEFDRLSPEVDAFLQSSDRAATAEDRLQMHIGPVAQLSNSGRTISFIAGYEPELDHMARSTSEVWWTKGRNWYDITYTARLNEVGGRFMKRATELLGIAMAEDARTALETARYVKTKEAEGVRVFAEEMGDRVVVKLSVYDSDMVNILRQVERRRYENGNWNVPCHSSAFKKIADLAEATPGAMALKEMADEMRTRLEAREAANPDAARRLWYFPTISIEGSLTDEKVSIHMSEFVRVWVDSISSIPKPHRRYDGNNWIVDNTPRVFDYLCRKFEAEHLKLSPKPVLPLRDQEMPAPPPYALEAVNVLRAHLARIAPDSIQEKSVDNRETPKLRAAR